MVRLLQQIAVIALPSQTLKFCWSSKSAAKIDPCFLSVAEKQAQAGGAELSQGDRIALDTWATPVWNRVWRLDRARVLAAVEEGRSIDEIRRFLIARSHAPIPETVMRLLGEVAERSAKVKDRGLALLVECADSALVALIAEDSQTRKHCLLAGERHLAIPASAEAAFARGLRKLGYLVATDEIKPARAGRGNPDGKLQSRLVDA